MSYGTFGAVLMEFLIYQKLVLVYKSTRGTSIAVPYWLLANYWFLSFSFACLWSFSYFLWLAYVIMIVVGLVELSIHTTFLPVILWHLWKGAQYYFSLVPFYSALLLFGSQKGCSSTISFLMILKIFWMINYCDL